MKSKVITRIIIDLLLAVSVLQGWWFIALLLGIIGLWMFPYYIELIIAGIVYDSLFGMIPKMGWKEYIGTILSVVIFGIGWWGRRVLKR